MVALTRMKRSGLSWLFLGNCVLTVCKDCKELIGRREFWFKEPA